MRLDRVPPRVVRFWACVDAAVIVLALPPTAELFLRMLWWLNGLITGLDAAVPAFSPIHLFFVNLAGMLIAVWAIARLVHPVGILALIDAAGRSAVALLIVWYLLAESAPPVLWVFVLTESAGAVMQFRACHGAPRAGRSSTPTVTLH